MSITFNNGNPGIPEKPGVNPTKPEKKIDPREQAKQRERERLQKQQQQIQKRLDTMKTSLAKPLRDLAKIIAQDDPNDDPQGLFRQIRPLLSKMGIATMTDASKTELVPGKIKKEDSLYKITLRRGAQLTEDIIEKIKRQGDNFETMQWSSQALEVYLWYPYKAPQEAEAPGTPPAPGAPA
jgi:hypothetical protein